MQAFLVVSIRAYSRTLIHHAKQHGVPFAALGPMNRQDPSFPACGGNCTVERSELFPIWRQDYVGFFALLCRFWQPIQVLVDCLTFGEAFVPFSERLEWKSINDNQFQIAVFCYGVQRHAIVNAPG